MVWYEITWKKKKKQKEDKAAGAGVGKRSKG